MLRLSFLALLNLAVAIGAFAPSIYAHAEEPAITVRVLTPRQGIPPRLFHDKRTALDAKIKKAEQRRDKAQQQADGLYSVRTSERRKFNAWFEKNGAGKPARNKRWEVGNKLADARLTMERFNSDFIYEPEKGKQLERDGPLRQEAWAATQRYYDLYEKYLTYDAVYYETQVAQYDKYIEFELSDMLAGMGSDLAIVGWETLNTTVSAFFSECIDGALTKVIADYTSVLRLSTPDRAPYGLSQPGLWGRFTDCALDSLKDSFAQMFESVTKVHFLHTVENLKIPRRVGIYWWDELTIGKATTKPGFQAALQNALGGLKDAFSGMKDKGKSGWAGGLAVRTMKRLRGEYIKKIQTNSTLTNNYYILQMIYTNRLRMFL